MTDAMQVLTHINEDCEVTMHTLTINGIPWFRGTDAATALGYVNAGKAIRDHVDTEDRRTLNNLRGSNLDPPLQCNEAAQVFISESGL